MKLVLALFAVLCVALATKEGDAIVDMIKDRPISQEAERLTGQSLVDYVNENQNLYKAKLNTRFAGMDIDKKRKLIGGVKGGVSMSAEKNKPFEINHDELDVTIPDSFDARTQWPACQSIGYIRDQSNCGACWAFGAAEAISDRICIASGGKTSVNISANDILSCCGYKCGDGCDGGWPLEAFQFWVAHGVVTGSNYADGAGCQPYPMPECEHHTNATHYQGCPSLPSYSTPKCEKKCHDGYPTSYAADKSYGRSAYSVRARVADIQKEILTNGPVEAAYTVYEDFEHYSSGIYVHTSGSYLGGHAVRMLGWGSENGVDYWLIANSWNSDWGENGYFRIIRGKDECGIESEIVAGLPK